MPGEEGSLSKRLNTLEEEEGEGRGRREEDKEKESVRGEEGITFQEIKHPQAATAVKKHNRHRDYLTHLLSHSSPTLPHTLPHPLIHEVPHPLIHPVPHPLIHPLFHPFLSLNHPHPFSYLHFTYCNLLLPHSYIHQQPGGIMHNTD